MKRKKIKLHNWLQLDEIREGMRVGYRFISHNVGIVKRVYTRKLQYGTAMLAEVEFYCPDLKRYEKAARLFDMDNIKENCKGSYVIECYIGDLYSDVPSSVDIIKSWLSASN